MAARPIPLDTAGTAVRTARPVLAMRRNVPEPDHGTAAPRGRPDRPPADDPAFAEFWRSTRDGVARALALTLGDADLAADATDEAMARAYQHWRKVGGYANPGGWVYRVGLNWARSALRRRRRANPHAPSEATSDPAVGDPAVAEALAALDLKHRSVVVCRFLLDWSVDQTAEALDVRPGTVKSRLSRALDQLRTTLDHLREGDTP